MFCYLRLIVARGALDDIADRSDFTEHRESETNEPHSSSSDEESKGLIFLLTIYKFYITCWYFNFS